MNQAVNRKAGQVFAAVLLALSVIIGGCSDNGTGSRSANGRMVLMMHDAPVNDLKQVWLTVESVTLIRSGTQIGDGTGPIVLSQPIRADFLAVGSVALVLAAAEVAEGTYSKIRLQVSDPEFVLKNDSVVTASEIQLVADGHVDLNFQGGFEIGSDSTAVLSLDLNLEKSIEVNATGNGRFILRPQIFVDSVSSEAKEAIVLGATVVARDSSSRQLELQPPGSQTSMTVTMSNQTQLIGIGGLPIVLGTISVGSRLDAAGRLDFRTGVFTASRIQLRT